MKYTRKGVPLVGAAATVYKGGEAVLYTLEIEG